MVGQIAMLGKGCLSLFSVAITKDLRLDNRNKDLFGLMVLEAGKFKSMVPASLLLQARSSCLVAHDRKRCCVHRGEKRGLHSHERGIYSFIRGFIRALSP